MDRMTRDIDPYCVETETIDELADLRGRRVLEIGCGDGRLTFRFAAKAAYVLGIDPDRELIRLARSDRPAELARKVRFRVAKRVAVPARKFELALFSWSL